MIRPGGGFLNTLIERPYNLVTVAIFRRTLWVAVSAVCRFTQPSVLDPQSCLSHAQRIMPGWKGVGRLSFCGRMRTDKPRSPLVS